MRVHNLPWLVDLLFSSKYVIFLASKHNIQGSTQKAKPTLTHGAARYKTKPVPFRNSISMAHSTAKLMKANRTAVNGKLSQTVNQSNYGKGVIRPSFPDNRAVLKAENEAVRGKISSLHEMVDFITIGADATQRPQMKSEQQATLPVESVEDQFVKLTSKVPGKPLLLQAAVVHAKVSSNSSLEEKLGAYNREQMTLSKEGKSVMKDEEKSEENDGTIMTIDNGRTSNLNDKQLLHVSKERLLGVNKTGNLPSEPIPTLKTEYKSFIAFRRKTPKVLDLNSAPTTGLAAKHSEFESTEYEARNNLPDIVKELEQTTTDWPYEESGDGKDTDESDDPQNAKNKNEEAINEDEFSVQRFPGLSLLEEDSGCTNSEIMKNVTLLGGLSSGKFKDRGWMGDFRLCIKICCLTKLCDLAFMLRNNCFTVECKSEQLCKAVPVKSSAEKPPLLAYIYARSLPVAKGSLTCDSSKTCA